MSAAKEGAREVSTAWCSLAVTVVEGAYFSGKAAGRRAEGSKLALSW